MALSSPRWFPVAVLLSVANLAGVWFAAGPGSELHATLHALLALGLGLWASRLQSQVRRPPPTELPAHLESLEGDLVGLRQDLIETQERLDFAERMLAQRPNQPEPVDRQGRRGPE